ncbi:Alkali-sensitive linkage protein 1 [Trametes pubescens]|uniref:Alkali-sensitive linkage protein 1 n=1 Tax=Trametes pubescens TaxID=154538 RepID=A0A1M2VSD1_TRAPU|nr:Alkali-sensitive linkage protein 1 [Trametes pubescens]
MTSRIAALFILIALFPRHAAAAVARAPPAHHVSRAITSKAGLGWANGAANDITQYLSTGKVQWYYTWSPDPVQTDIEFVPMLWGLKQTDEWDSNINKTIAAQHVTSVLGFNEPEIEGQGNLSPADGATQWKAHIEPLKGLNVRLGAPAPSGSPTGKQWVTDWLSACDGGCTVDFMPLHWYDVNSTAFIEYLEDYHNTFQKPIWVTEWACQNFNQADRQCSLDDIVGFMNATQSFMDSTDWVERYAWFGAMENLQGVNQENALMSTSGSITSLGEQYIGAATPNVTSDYQPGVVHGGSGVSAPSATQASSSSESRQAILWQVVTFGTLASLFLCS